MWQAAHLAFGFLGASGLGELAAGLPATLQAAGAKLAVGDINGAIDAVILSGMQPIINILLGVWTPMQAVLQRPFAVAAPDRVRQFAAVNCEAVRLFARGQGAT